MEEEQIVKSQLQPIVGGEIALLMIFEGGQSILYCEFSWFFHSIPVSIFKYNIRDFIGECYRADIEGNRWALNGYQGKGRDHCLGGT